MIQPQIEFNGRIFHTGYVPQRNTKELRYAYMPRFGTPNWNIAASLPRPNRRFQNGEPSCVGHTLAQCYQVLRPDMPEFSSAYIWQSGKNLRGWKGYTGIYIMDGCDVSLAGVPSEADLPTNFSTQDYTIPSNLKLNDALQSHQVATGIGADAVYDAIRAGIPVASGIWMDSLSFHNMQFQGGVVTSFNPDRTKWDLAHAMIPVDALMLPNGRKVVIYQNTWLDFWNDANSALPGKLTAFDIAFDVDVLNVVGFEHRILSPEPRIPDPDPNPNPEPDFKSLYKTFYNHDADLELKAIAEEKRRTTSPSARTRIQHYADGINRLTRRVNSL